MEIEILGAKDPQTDRLVENVKNALQKIQAFVRIRKITDPKKISSYGPILLPALIINGNIKVNGRVPQEAEIIKLIKSEAQRR